MKELVLLTGASSGIGLEMAKELAAKKMDLVLVARRGEILEGIKIVAREGVEFMLAGKGTKFVGLMNWFIANTPRFSPRWLTLKITKHLASRKK